MRDALINYCHREDVNENRPEVVRRSCCARKPIESNGDRCGQESEEESPQGIYSGGRETIEGTLESQNASSKAYEVDEAIRGFASAKGISARNWSRPSAIELNPTRYRKQPGFFCSHPRHGTTVSAVTRSQNLSTLSAVLSRVPQSASRTDTWRNM
jgi:hypothetical protein